MPRAQLSLANLCMNPENSKSVHSFASVEVHERLVLYIDLLGFKNKVNKSDTQSQQQIVNFYSFLLDNFKSDGFLESTGEGAANIQISSSFFSDSLISSYPINIEQILWDRMYPNLDKKLSGLKAKEPSLIYAIHKVWVIQKECLLQLGLLIRGAITIGNAFHANSKNTVFGPAVNCAVGFEQDIACTPRVIIDPKLKGAIQSFNYGHLKQDSDGYWFVNGLLTSLHGEDPKKIKTAIEAGLKNENYKYRQKWQWMALQFNDELKKTSH